MCSSTLIAPTGDRQLTLIRRDRGKGPSGCPESGFPRWAGPVLRLGCSRRTPQSHARGWVHQEIGYAVAMRVPFVAVCIGEVPDGMIKMAHAMVVEDLGNLKERLGRVDLTHLVENAAGNWVPPSGCAREPEERAKMIENFSDAARATVGPACVRVQGGAQFVQPS